MKRLVSIWAAAALIVPSFALAAPSSPKPSDWSFLAPVSPDAALAKVHEFAGCVASKRPAAVRKTLLMDYTSAEYRKSVADIAQGTSCLKGGKLRIGGAVFPGALAEAAFLADFGAQPIGKVLPSDWTVNPIEAKDDIDFVSYCTLQKAPESVRALMGSQPGSAAEGAALQPIAAVLPSCVKEGMQARFNKSGLRALLALALFRAADHYRSA